MTQGFRNPQPPVEAQVCDRGHQIKGKEILVGPGPVFKVPALKLVVPGGEPALIALSFRPRFPAIVAENPSPGEAFPGSGGFFTGAGTVSRPQNSLFADLFWKVNNAFFSTRVDIRTGTILNLFADSIDVFVSSENTSGSGAGAVETDAVECGAIYGGVITNVKPTRTVEIFAAIAAFWMIPVPNFAREVQVLRTNAGATQAFTLVQEDEQGFGLSQINIPAGADMTGPQPLAERCTQLFLTPGNAALSTTWQVIFTLDL
jgi:hypothetical protein